MKTIKKSRLHGKIENKYTVTNSEGLILLETMNGDEKKYPALFNSEEDAISYLKLNEATEEEISRLNIENCAISYFDEGGILIEFNNE